MKFPVLKRRKAPRALCSVCEGYGIVARAEVYLRDPVCDCGAGPYDELTLHAPDCDSVPCPFDQLIGDLNDSLR